SSDRTRRPCYEPPPPMVDDAASPRTPPPPVAVARGILRKMVPIAVGALVGAGWLNQGATLTDYEALGPPDGWVGAARRPLLSLYRRANDEELYFDAARAIRGLPRYGAADGRRGEVPEAFRGRALPAADGHWHRPYAEVPLEYPAVVLPFIVAPTFV